MTFQKANEVKLTQCTVGQKNEKHPIYFNTNYRTERKLVPIIMDCLLQSDALKFFLGVCLHGESQPNFNFFQCEPPNFSMKS